MTARALRLPFAFLLFVTTVCAQQLPVPTYAPSTPLRAGASGQMPGAAPRAQFMQAPLSFEPNQGQAGAQVKFVSRGPGYSLLLTADSAVLNLTHNTGTKEAPAISSSQVAIDLLGGDGKPQVEAVDPLPGKSNYLIGNDLKAWRTNVPTYRKVRYRGVYPGIDLVYYGNQRQLEYDFVVAPGRDPQAIALRLRGADKLEINKDGELVVRTAGGELRFYRPYIYQEGPKGIETVAGSYLLRADHTVAFRVGDYDRKRALVIDPVLSYATYLGGASYDQAYAIAADTQAQPQDTYVYVAGYTCSSGMPTTTGVVQPTSSGCDAFVLKLQPSTNTLMWATYLGGSASDGAYGIAVEPGNANPNVYVTGYTNSANFPTTDLSPLHGYQNAFYSKLNNTGTVLFFSTYVGGSGSDEARAIAVDASGNAFIAGDTTSLDFPVLNNAYTPIQGGVYVSNNAGTLWSLSRTSQTILSPYIKALAVAPAYTTPTVMPSIVYAGTLYGGLWTSNDGGQIWAHSNTGMSAPP